MKLIKTDSMPFGDNLTFAVDDSEIVLRPYYGFNDREKFEMREAVPIGSYANGAPKYGFVERISGQAFVTFYSSIGD